MSFENARLQLTDVKSKIKNVSKCFPEKKNRAGILRGYLDDLIVLKDELKIIGNEYFKISKSSFYWESKYRKCSYIGLLIKHLHQLVEELCTRHRT